MNRQRYSVEYGIDTPEGRVCAAESGAYWTRRGAYRAGRRALGRPAWRVVVFARNGSMFDAEDEFMGLPVRGFTVEGYDEHGTNFSMDFDHNGEF